MDVKSCSLTDFNGVGGGTDVKHLTAVRSIVEVTKIQAISISYKSGEKTNLRQRTASIVSRWQWAACAIIRAGLLSSGTIHLVYWRLLIHRIHIIHSQCIPGHGMRILVASSCWYVTGVAAGTTVFLVRTADSLQQHNDNDTVHTCKVGFLSHEWLQLWPDALCNTTNDSDNSRNQPGVCQVTVHCTYFSLLYAPVLILSHTI